MPEAIRNCSCIHDGEYFIEIGVIACEGFLVEIQDFIAWSHYERGAELHRATASVVLTMPAEQ